VNNTALEEFARNMEWAPDQATYKRISGSGSRDVRLKAVTDQTQSPGADRDLFRLCLAIGSAPRGESFEILRRKLLVHPLVTKHIQRDAARKLCGGGSLAPCKTPSDVWVERWMMLVLLLNGQSGVSRLDVSTCAWAALSTPYLVMNKIRDSIFESALPRHVVSHEAMPEPMMYVTFEGSPGGYIKGGRYYESWSYCLTASHDAIDVVVAEMTGNSSNSLDGAQFSGTRIPIGVEFDPGCAQGDEHEFHARVLKLLSFINSKFIPKTGKRLCRDDRKLMQRAGFETKDPTLVFVDLRRPENLTELARDPSASGGNYSCQWIVSGHHRAQWYPSEKSHHVLWIAPYVKGPEGTPLKKKLYRVRR